MEMRSSIGSASCNLTNYGERQNKSGSEFEDRISSLPDCILVHILSLLPTRDAVRTMLISRFGQLWTSIHRLEFDWEVDYEVETCLNFIRHALIHHSRPKIFKFILTFPFHYSYLSDDENIRKDETYIRERELAKEIDSWINFSVRKEVRLLYLDMDSSDCDPKYFYILPNVVFRSCFLTELELNYCQVKPEGFIHMKSLKKLSFGEIKLSDNVLHSILDGCPLLEYLCLDGCFGFHKLNLTSPCLRTLRIFSSGNSKLELSCPTVWSLYVSGILARVELKNVSALVSVQLSYFAGRVEEKQFLEVRGLFEKLHHAEVLKMCTWCIMVFTICELKTLPSPSFDCKHLVLGTFLSKWHLRGIASLLRNSIHLESLSIELQGSIYALRDDETEWLERCYYYDEVSYWHMIEPIDCLMNKLKSVNIYARKGGSVINSQVIQLVKFLLRSSLVLETIVITTKPDGEPQWMERLVEFTKTLSSFPRASSEAVILFI